MFNEDEIENTCGGRRREFEIAEVLPGEGLWLSFTAVRRQVDTGEDSAQTVCKGKGDRDHRLGAYAELPVQQRAVSRVFVNCIFTEWLAGGEYHADEALVSWQPEFAIQEILGVFTAAENRNQVIAGAVGKPYRPVTGAGFSKGCQQGVFCQWREQPGEASGIKMITHAGEFIAQVLGGTGKLGVWRYT